MSESKSLQYSNDETQTIFVFCKQMVLNFFQIDRKFRLSTEKIKTPNLRYRLSN